MPLEYAGVLAVPLIVGLVEAAKRMGMNTVWATPLAIGCGLALTVGNELARQAPGAEPWLNALMWGLALGLSASGLYSGSKKIVEG